MKIKEYLEENKGFACINLIYFKAKKEMLVGLSSIYDEPFYFARDKKTGEIEGPYYFGFSLEKIKEVLEYDMRRNAKVIERISEGEKVS